MPDEKWLPIPGFPGYEASDQGNIRSLKRSQVRVRKPYLWRGKTGRPGRKKPAKSQYRMVRLFDGAGQWKAVKVSRLVLLAHVGQPPFPRADARHLNDDSLNDSLANLAWGTRKENEDDKRRNGNAPVGENHGRSRLTNADVRAIRAAATTGATNQAIADQYGVTQPTISKIVTRKSWSHVPIEGDSIAL